MIPSPLSDAELIERLDYMRGRGTCHGYGCPMDMDAFSTRTDRCVESCGEQGYAEEIAVYAELIELRQRVKTLEAERDERLFKGRIDHVMGEPHSAITVEQIEAALRNTFIRTVYPERNSYIGELRFVHSPYAVSEMAAALHAALRSQETR